MNIEQIMKRLEASQVAEASGIKTAADKNTATTTTVDSLRSSLRNALSAGQEEQTKIASVEQQQQGDPVADLTKMAQDLSNAEHEALLKYARMYGAAYADGAIERFAQYEEAATKVASAPASNDEILQAAYVQGYRAKEAEMVANSLPEEMQKFAAENPQAAQQAYEQGYRDKMAELEKSAQEEFEQGYNDTLQEIHKIAAEVYTNAAYTTNDLVRHLQQQQQQ